MAQYLKDAVQESIAAAAVRVFAQRGYAGATMGEIAAAAGISTGNVYRYYQNKSVLFHEVLSDAFVRRFGALLRRRVRSLDGVADVRTLEADHLFHLASEDLLRFCIDNRLRVVILLGRCAGSRHADFAERTVTDLIRLAIAHFRARDPRLEVTPALHTTLTQIYRNFVHTMVTVLADNDDEAVIREMVSGHSRYHLAGLKELFEGSGSASARRPDALGARRATRRR